MKTSKMEIAKAKIREIRGKARERIVNGSDLEQVLIEAHDDGWGYTSGGTVANKYGYPAHQFQLRHSLSITIYIACRIILDGDGK